IPFGGIFTNQNVDLSHQTTVVSDAVRNPKGMESTHWRDRHSRDHMVHKVSGLLGHPASATRRIPSPSVAGKRNRSIVSTRLTADAYKAMRQNAALQKRAEFLFNDFGTGRSRSS